MENVFKYFEFSDFFKDESNQFSGNDICFTELNATHFLIFEKDNITYHLYVSRYLQRKDIGKKKPEILELVIENYDKSIPEHRIALRQYLDQT
ncbi:hypothetical protein [uncultured Polaribacter sp.]|uniref:hypothetical protein n=1 Tax=uncultured Polaribacter sp. TaxID=174711 RepID=UPI0026230036|nr:hypothetical protein [uncultured Polaribacter sp.]